MAAPSAMSEPSASPAEEPSRRLRRRRRWRRVVLFLIVLSIVLPLVVFVAATVSLRSAAVRRAVLARVSAYLEREMGLAVQAEDFDVRWEGFALEGVRVGAPGAAPLLVAERVAAGVDYGTLRDEVLVIRSLEVVGPRLDLAAPFPELPEAEPGGGAGFEIRRLALRRGAVMGAPPGEAVAEWVRAWQVGGIAAHGSFVGEVWDLTVDAAQGRVERPGFEPLALAITGRARYRDGRPLAITALRATGPGLRLSSSATLGLAAGQPTAVDFDTEVEPRLLAAGAPPGGTVGAVGAVRLPERAGRIAVRARDAPAEVLRPYLDAALFRDLSLARTVADARADLTLGPGDLTRAAGKVEAVWRRDDRRLVQLTATVTPGAPVGAGAQSEPGIRLAVEGDLLPASRGRRHLSGTITAASWTDLAGATAERIDAELRAPDARAAWAELRALWPHWVPELPAGAPVQGSLAADLRLAGALAAPHAQLAATWVPEAGSRLGVQAEAQLPDGSGSAQIEVQALPIALLESFAAGAMTTAGAEPAESARASVVVAPATAPPATASAPNGAKPAGADSASPADAAGAPRAGSDRWAGTLSGTIDLSGSLRAIRARVDLAGAGLAAPPWLDGAESVSLGADVAVVPERAGEPLVVKGVVFLDGNGLSARASDAQQLAAARLHANVEGVLQMRATPSFAGRFLLAGTGLDAPGTARARDLRIEGTMDVAGTLATSSGSARLEASGVELTAAASASTPPVTLDALRLDAALRDREVQLHSFSATAGEQTAAGSGRFLAEPLLAEADLDLRLTRPIAAIRDARLTASLRGGTLVLDAPRIATEGGAASLAATVPLGALRSIPQLTAAIDALPFAAAPGPVSLRLAAPELDSAPLLAALQLPPRAERLRASGLTAALTIDPAAPTAVRDAHGEIRLDALAVDTPDAHAAAEGPLVARLAGARLELLPVRLRFAGGAVDGAGLELRGRADLAPGWRPQDPPAALVAHLALDATGSLDAALLNPYLEGGAGSGALAVTAAVSGPPDALTADVAADGPDASFFWPSPYATRLQAPHAALSLRDGRWTLDRARAVWNGGTLAVSGGGAADGGAALAFDLAGVRYRLDYGLAAQLSGRLTLDLPPAGRSRLAGRLTLDRGVLDRDVNLDREVRDLLLAPEDLPGTEESALADLDLDITVDTVDGVRIRNNVADLRAWWRSLAVTGTAEAPVVKGRIDLDPGGYVYAYGQDVRIDRGALIFTGDPLTDPRMELSTTSSLQDPTIARRRGAESPLAALDEPERRPGETSAGAAQGSPGEALQAGLAAYYGERVVSRLGATVGLQRVVVYPPVIQEEDPSARLEVGRDLSRNTSFALSVDLRNAGRRTYLVDLHGFRELPGLALQAFVTDEEREGANLQQVLELGASRPPPETAPRLRRLRLAGVGGVRGRVLRRAVPLARGAPVPESAAFDVEVVLADALRRRGYPDAKIAVAVTPVAGRPPRVDVTVRVEPGPRVEVVFAGDQPPVALRSAIAALYRGDFYEPAAIAEMQKETVRAFRARGHLEPQVEIAVRAQPDGTRAVTVQSAAGPRAELRQVTIAGPDPETAALAARRFAGTLSRAELAAGLPGADRFLLDALRALGYPQARIAGRTLEEGGERLAVQVEPGERQVVAAVAVEGVEEEERRRLAALVPVAPGDPLRLDRVAEGALRLERALAADGHADAVVRTAVEPGPPERPLAVAVRYAVAPGARLRLAGVDFAGERWSRRERLARIAGLEPGAPFTTGAVEEARARLFQSGAFSRVDSDVDRAAEGEARVSFTVAERPRFHLGYGLRWESGVDPAAVVDLLDRNFLGRGMSLGLRGLYEPNDRRGRLFLRTGAFSRAGLSLEAFAQARRRLPPAENLIEDGLETALQLARPFGERTTGRLYARYRSTRLYETEPDPFFPLDIEIRHPYVGAQLLYESLDDRLDPHAGLFASLDLSGSGTFVGSDFDYARLFGQVQLYRGGRAAGRRFVWAQSARVGWARAFAGQELIRFERFFAGGEHSVRGYATESLGPQEALGGLVRPLGGEALLVLNEVLRVGLPWDLTGILFADAGQIWAEASAVGWDLATAVGFGLRAATPVGLLRVDAAFPLDRRPGEESYRLYVGFGNAF